MHMAFRSIALDIIMEYVFARSYDAISAPHFRNIVIVSIHKCLKMFLVMKHFPMAFAILDKLPGWLTVKLSPSAVGLPETIVGISSTFLHNDPSFFPDPFKFDPERWLKGAESKALEKWLVPFSTGPRQCLGVKCVFFLASRKEDMVDECHHGSLAWAELYLIFGNMFARLDISIHDMTYDFSSIPLSSMKADLNCA